MFDIKDYYTVITHLKQISPTTYDDNGKAITILCPYCQDSSRKNAHHHGHLNIAKDKPVFYCFLCDTAGTLVKLLVETDFQDEDTLELLKTFVKHSGGTRNYYAIKQKKVKFYDNIKSNILKFKKEYPDAYPIFSEYIYSRIGKVDFGEFLISPTIYDNKNCLEFFDSYGNLTVRRYINEKTRYFDRSRNGLYFFQDLNFFKRRKLVIAEGPFDIINLYLYNCNFKNSNYVSVNGKKYTSALEQMILGEMLIGDYEINLIFDTDNSNNFRKNLISARLLCKLYNPDIKVRAWIPIVGPDAGFFPGLKEI